MSPFVGPSYPLQAKKADGQRSINCYLSSVESGTGKAAFILKSVPGLTLFASMGAVYRGSLVAGSRTFVVAGNKLYEVAADGSKTDRGTLISSTGRVSMAVGVSHLVIVDGPKGYVLTLATNVFANITDPDFYGSRFTAFLSNYFVFIRPDTQQYYISDIDNATSFDALKFASAESNPDKLTVVLADHNELKLFGEKTVETAIDNGGADFPFSRNRGALMEVGCIAPDSAIKLDNALFWLGQSDSGGGMVYRSSGYTPAIISRDAENEYLQGSTNLSGASAYGFQHAGKTFYCLNAPGLSTTLVYEAKSQQWFEMAELVDGVYAPFRGVDHFYAFGKNLIAGADGRIYTLDSNSHSLAGDVLARDRIGPNNGPGMYPKFTLDCTVGKAASGQNPLVQMRYSNDGGYNWSSWQTRSVGQIGQFGLRVVWHRCGYTPRGGSRVYQVRCTDDVEFDVLGAE